MITNQTYTSKILKAGALLDDTKSLFLNWDLSYSVEENIQTIGENNPVGKASRSRLKAMMRIFRQRYLFDENIAQSLAILVQNQIAPEALYKILYFYAARADDLLKDSVLVVLKELRSTGRTQIEVKDIETKLRAWMQEGRILETWSDSTILRVARGLLAALRDFEVLQGAVHKSFAPNYLPVEAFAYIAYYLRTLQPSGDLLIKHPLWQLYFLTSTDVERLFIQADQAKLLGYHAAGRVIRIDFPANTIQEFSYVILRRTS